MLARSFAPGSAVMVALIFWMSPMESVASTNHHVILITIDGVAASYLSDPQAPLPTLRRLAADGAAAESLRVSNPSKAMKVLNS